MYLTLPLPVGKTRSVKLFLVSADGSAPLAEISVEVPKAGTVKHLYQAIAQVGASPPYATFPSGMALQSWDVDDIVLTFLGRCFQVADVPAEQATQLLLVVELVHHKVHTPLIYASRPSR